MDTEQALSEEQLPKKSFHHTICIIIGVFLVVLSSLITYLIVKQSGGKDPLENYLSSLPTPSPAPTVVYQTPTLIYPTPLYIDTPGDKELSDIVTPPNFNGSLKINLTTPIAWQTTFVETKYMQPQFDSQNATLAVAESLPFSTDHLGIDEKFKIKNALSFFDLTEWLSHDQVDPKDPVYFISKGDKKAYIDFLINLRKTKNVSDFSECKIIDIMQTCSHELQSEYVESADKLFSGYATVMTNHQAVQYDLNAYIYMAGTIDGHTILVQGRYAFYDNLYKKINKIENDTFTQKSLEAIDQIHKKGLPADSQALYAKVLKAVRTLHIEKMPQ